MKSWWILITLLLQVMNIRAELYWGDIINSEQINLDKADLTRPVGAYKKLMEWKLPKLEDRDIYQCLI